MVKEVKQAAVNTKGRVLHFADAIWAFFVDVAMVFGGVDLITRQSVADLGVVEVPYPGILGAVLLTAVITKYFMMTLRKDQ